jgi:uroporphyrinogen III methyltransferase/synthase
MITFTSSSTAANFAALVKDGKLEEVLHDVAVASIGPITSETLRKLGLPVTVEAAESTIPGLVRAIRQYFTASGP